MFFSEHPYFSPEGMDRIIDEASPEEINAVYKSYQARSRALLEALESFIDRLGMTEMPDDHKVVMVQVMAQVAITLGNVSFLRAGKDILDFVEAGITTAFVAGMRYQSMREGSDEPLIHQQSD